jgi:hypothetical protein
VAVLEDQRETGRLPRRADQFNAIHEALVARFGELAAQLPPPFCLAAVRTRKKTGAPSPTCATVRPGRLHGQMPSPSRTSACPRTAASPRWTIR